MKKFKQPLLTVIIIFATAYVLSLVGCAPSGDKSVGAEAPPFSGDTSEPVPGTEPRPVEVKPVQVDPVKMRECRDNEFLALQSWSSALSASDAGIKAMGDQLSSWKKKDEIIKLAQKAIVQCDQVQAYHLNNPCKKVVDKNIVNPAGTIKAYDAFRIRARCEITNKYLVLFNARPVIAVKPAVPAVPPVVIPPVPIPPNELPVNVLPATGNDIEARDMNECNEAEFAKLKPWRAALDQANRNIAKLGGQSHWKYDINAIDSSKAATQMCESLITYHQDQPCKRFVKDDKSAATITKIYSAESLREQCFTARTYQYEFAQKDISLIIPGARLYFDTAVISGKAMSPGYASGVTVGQCIVSNTTQSPITYNSEKALVAEARVYPLNGIEGFQMFVMVTAEGIKLECYGLNYQSVKTSKNEVVRLLEQKQTNIVLSYELN